MAASDRMIIRQASGVKKYLAVIVMVVFGVLIFNGESFEIDGREIHAPVWCRIIGGSLCGAGLLIALYREDVVLDRRGREVIARRGLLFPMLKTAHPLDLFETLVINREVATRFRSRNVMGRRIPVPRQEATITLTLRGPDQAVTLLDFDEDPSKAETTLIYGRVRDRARAMGEYLDLPIHHEAGAGAVSARYNPTKLNESLASWNAKRRGGTASEE